MSGPNLLRCFACGRELSSVWAEVKVPGARSRYAPVCSDRCLSDAAEGVRADINCEHCGEPTDPSDRLPTAAGGVSDSSCALKLANAHAVQRGALLGGRGLTVLGGGRSS